MAWLLCVCIGHSSALRMRVCVSLAYEAQLSLDCNLNQTQTPALGLLRFYWHSLVYAYICAYVLRLYRHSSDAVSSISRACARVWVGLCVFCLAYGIGTALFAFLPLVAPAHVCVYGPS